MREYKFDKKQSVVASLLAATSPWSIVISRFGYESNLGLMFFIAGLISIFVFLRKKSNLWLLLSGVLFGLTWYSYIAYRLVVPLILIGFGFFFLRTKKENVKHLILLIAAFVIIILPLLPTVFAKEGTARFSQIGLFSDTGVPMEINDERLLCGGNVPRQLCYLAFNKPVIDGRILIERFVNVFSSDYLFLNGEGDLRMLSVDHFGLFYIWLLPFFIFGLIVLLTGAFKKENKSLELFCLYGLFVTVLPSVLAGEAQRVRLSPLFPFLIITLMYGFVFVENYIKKKAVKNFYYFSIILLSLLFCGYFMLNFLTIHIKKYEATFNSHVPKLVEYLKNLPKDTDVYITSFGYSIYYYIYYAKVTPQDVQRYAIWEKPDETGFAHITDYKNLHVTWKGVNVVFCQLGKKSKKAIYLTDTPIKELKSIKKINTFDDVHTLFYAYDIKSSMRTVCPDL